MTLKPIPRLILIVAAVAGSAYGVSKFMEGRQAAVPGSAQVAAPAIAIPAAQPASPEALKSTGNAYSDIVEKGVVRMSVQSPSKPFYSVENGRPTGFNVEFANLLFKQQEFTTRHSSIRIDFDHAVDTYPAVPEQLLKVDTRGNPLVDIAIDGLTFSDTDLPGVVYSIPYVDDFGYSLITPQSVTLRSEADIDTMTLGVLKDDPDVKAYVSRKFPHAKIVELSDASINGERSWINHFIKAGQVDGVVYDYPFAVAEISGTSLQFAVAKLPGSDIKYKIGVRASDAQLLENLNVAIRKVKASPGYVELIKKYFMSANAAPVKAASSNEIMYVVKAGDTLSTIAGVVLGDKMRFPEIEVRNNLANPNLIRIGQKLVIAK